jgi:NADH-quinone oxidoreductase subunit L
MVFGMFGSTDLRFLTREALLPLNTSWSLVFGLGLLCGTIAKSAQFPLQIWLPGAMAGPTPVSALIHAATMVAAGVYLLIRLFPLLDDTILDLAAGIGTVTLFMGAVTALFQTDIKRLLAFSTVSQLGYMVMAVGIGIPGAAMFHLVTHAFFKAGLFLCAGSVIHALHEAGHQTHIQFDAQDMRLMGGLRRKMPVTFLCFTICGLALAGVPLFSGFLSKDAILAASLGWAAGAYTGLAYLVPLLGFLSALLTSCYVGRQLALVFRDKFRLNEPAVYAVVAESPLIMLAPVILLSLLSLFFVFSVNPLETSAGWLYRALAAGESESHGWHTWAASTSIALAAGGLLAGYFFVNRSLFIPTPLRQLSRHNWYLDDAFRLVVILPGKLGARIVRQLDRKVLDTVIDTAGILTVVLAHITAWFDRFVVDGAVRFAAFAAGRAGMTVRAGSGQVQTYVAGTVLTFIALLVWMLLTQD